jgi:hypothetical protein
MKITIQAAAQILGRRGGLKQVPKGFAVISKKRQREITRLATLGRILVARKRRIAREQENRQRFGL